MRIPKIYHSTMTPIADNTERIEGEDIEHLVLDNAVALELARQGATKLAQSLDGVIRATDKATIEFAALVEQFNRLDAAEQKRQVSRIQQGHHGKKGGRPRKPKA
jgi:hypothetical protein